MNITKYVLEGLVIRYHTISLKAPYLIMTHKLLLLLFYVYIMLTR